MNLTFCFIMILNLSTPTMQRYIKFRWINYFFLCFLNPSFLVSLLNHSTQLNWLIVSTYTVACSSFQRMVAQTTYISQCSSFARSEFTVSKCYQWEISFGIILNQGGGTNSLFCWVATLNGESHYHLLKHSTLLIHNSHSI
jgi:hypothetical protein